MQMYNYSFKEAIVILKRELKIKLATISTLHYRLSKLDDNIGKSNIKNISRDGKKN